MVEFGEGGIAKMFPFWMVERPAYFMSLAGRYRSFSELVQCSAVQRSTVVHSAFVIGR